MRTKTDPPAGGRLRTPDAAAYLGVSASYLEKLRVTGGGPAFAVMGRAVSYAVADLEEWATARTVQNTSEARLELPRRLAASRQSAKPVALEGFAPVKALR